MIDEMLEILPVSENEIRELIIINKKLRIMRENTGLKGRYSVMNLIIIRLGVKMR